MFDFVVCYVIVPSAAVGLRMNITVHEVCKNFKARLWKCVCVCVCVYSKLECIFSLLSLVLWCDITSPAVSCV
jgi:hypothetical protein